MLSYHRTLCWANLDNSFFTKQRCIMFKSECQVSNSCIHFNKIFFKYTTTYVKNSIFLKKTIILNFEWAINNKAFFNTVGIKLWITVWEGSDKSQLTTKLHPKRRRYRISPRIIQTTVKIHSSIQKKTSGKLRSWTSWNMFIVHNLVINYM